jgi:Sulfotransferase domain
MRKREALQRLVRCSPLLAALRPHLGQKVFGIGLPKTGSKTLGSALRTLGYRVFSWSGDSADFTLRWHEGRFSREMALTIKSYDAFEDLPWPLLYEQLDRLEPNARFVLTVRQDPEVWLQSIQGHIDRLVPWVGHYLVYGSYDPVQDAEKYLSVYKRHVDRVVEHFRGRPNKLLIMCFEKGDGWPELCDFLEIPARPTVPFPHLNQAPSGDQEGHQSP